MNNTLLPCPFCGGEAKIKSRYIGYGSVGLGAHDWYSVECKECRAKGYEYGMEPEAIAAWNRRADAVPVVRGEWKTWEEQFPDRTTRKKNNLGVFCSACQLHADNMTSFCPNCGAHMMERSGRRTYDEIVSKLHARGLNLKEAANDARA